MVAHQTGPEAIGELAQVFTDLDKDGDGMLSFNELIEGLKKIGHNVDDAIAVYKEKLDPTKKINYNGKT